MNSFIKNRRYQHIVQKMLDKYGYTIDATYETLVKELDIKYTDVYRIFKLLREIGLMTDEPVNGTRKVYVISRDVDRYLREAVHENTLKKALLKNKILNNIATFPAINKYCKENEYSLTETDCHVLFFLLGTLEAIKNTEETDEIIIGWSIREIANLTGCSKSGVQRSLCRLQEYKLLNIEERLTNKKYEDAYNNNPDQFRKNKGKRMETTYYLNKPLILSLRETLKTDKEWRDTYNKVILANLN